MRVRYAILALLFVAAGAFQVRSIRERFPQWFGAYQPPAWPFLIDADRAEPGFTIRFLTPDAVRAGLLSGDMLLAIEGKPVTGSAVFGRVIGEASAGDIIHVVVRRNDGKTLPATLMLTMANQQLIGPVSVIGAAIISSFCLLLGFWVVAIRPGDRLAWLLLAFLLGFTTFFNPFLEGWGPLTRDLGAVYEVVLNGTWGIWLLLFAMSFPEPLPAGSRLRSMWRWVAWAIIVPSAVRTVTDVIVSIGALENYAAVFPLVRVMRPFGPLFVIASYVASVAFLVCLASKWRIPAKADARRRLRVVLVAAFVSYPLLLICNLIARVRHSRVEELFPPWLYNTSYLLEFLFPLAVAYVILVQRAMDVRLILRQSLQYALARRGVILLQIALSAIFFVFLARLVTAHAMSYGSTVFSMGAGLWAIFLLNGVTHRLAKVIDRRFFREVYDAEQILSDLSREVRTMVQTAPLLEKVARRISEALHVPRIAVLLDGNGRYAPAYAYGYPNEPNVVFTEDAATVREMKLEKEPLRVYLNDRDDWVYRPDIGPAERDQLRELDPEVLLPLLAQEDLIGFMALGPKLSEAPYSGSDLQLLSSVAAQTSLALQVSRLTAAASEEAAQREGLKRELEIAREVQAKLFPQIFPAVPGLEYAAECRPAREVGGDYYDFLELPDGRLAIAIGDVSGKGIGAALMMANLQAALRGLVTSARDFPAMLTRLNRMVYQASSANRYATFFFAAFDGQTRRLTYVNAGHNPPIVLRHKNGADRAIRLDVGGAVIGLLPEVAYEEGGCDLQADDLLILFTDGISESMNAADEEWGEERLIACARTCEGLEARASLERLMSAAAAFAAGAPQHDDMTLVVAQVTKLKPALSPATPAI